MDPKIHNCKDDHIHIAAEDQCDSKESAWFEYVSLIHQAIPQGNLDDVSLNTTFLNKEISAPILIDALTGGTPLAKKINEILAKTAEKYNIPMGVGSQRIMMEDHSVFPPFKLFEI